MAQRLIRLTLYDDAILSALDRLSRVRKQSMFVVEALRHYLDTKEGQQLLLALTESVSFQRQSETKIHGIVEKEKSKSNIDDIFS
ncbi:hypothetical protein EDC39_11288 [Geothermobacter ehrlichii]|uniref:Uncharacterized protein n=1 Tax=Geothermobacter ehrlichii TaxID=213224 RepID=A0A5D3WFV2_9BACT|nr:hypothetical protein [Geothermobacter ehrlichii]TYO96800.1 hypothetical protein EDC39_11288 [Geothermobacter ehrlichii]